MFISTKSFWRFDVNQHKLRIQFTENCVRMNRVNLKFTRPTPDLPSSYYECYAFIMIKIIICFELLL